MTNDELNLKKLVQKRGICKAQLTMFDTYLSGLNTEELTSTDLTNIENRLQKLQPFFDSFNDVQNEIECLSVVGSDNVKIFHYWRRTWLFQYSLCIYQRSKIAPDPKISNLLPPVVTSSN
uniref:Uncharacterized protein n=1 Tax=Photinus pyralis TaxID=7054 RepID=A0A1Y1N1B3_PHOPY